MWLPLLAAQVAEMPSPSEATAIGSPAAPRHRLLQATARDIPGEPGGSAHRPRVLFIYPIEASFIRTDLGLLQTFCDVTPFHFAGKTSYPRLLKQIASTEVVFSWFALGFSGIANLAAKATGAQSITVAGGWDVSSFPEIGYGLLLTNWGVLRARLALSTADQVLAFSEWSKHAIERVSPRCRVRTAYLGVDTASFRPSKKEDLVVCVAHISNENLARKGLRTFVRAAKLVPNARFVLVGQHLDDAILELRAEARDRVVFPGRLGDEELRGLLSHAKVYVQPSYTEGFGVALAEAMASGCIPIATNRGAIPEVLDSAGIYIEYGNQKQLADAIQSALESTDGERARQRVIERFGLEARLRELRWAVDEAWSGGV